MVFWSAPPVTRRLPIRGLTENTEYRYEVSAVNGAMLEGPASPTVPITTLADLSAPLIIGVAAVGTPNHVTVAFSEPIEAGSAAAIANYELDQGATVTGAVLLSDAITVRLTTSSLQTGLVYTLTVNGIVDRAAAGNAIAANSQATFSLLLVSSEGLLAHWPMDGDVRDVTGSHNGTIVGPELFGAGQLGEAINLDGAYVNVGSDAALDDLTDFSYSAWVLPHESGDREIISKNGSGRELRLAGEGASLYLRGCVRAASNGCSNSLPGAMVLNRWQHVVMTYSDGGDRRVHLYLDGQELAYSLHDTASGALQDDNAADMNLGRRSTGDRVFDGLLDQIRIYNRVLTPAEIGALAAETAGLPGVVFADSFED